MTNRTETRTQMTKGDASHSGSQRKYVTVPTNTEQMPATPMGGLVIYIELSENYHTIRNSLPSSRNSMILTGKYKLIS